MKKFFSPIDSFISSLLNVGRHFLSQTKNILVATDECRVLHSPYIFFNTSEEVFSRGWLQKYFKELGWKDGS